MAQVSENNPQAMFHRTSDKPVPEFIERALTSMFGLDEFGDPILRARFDADKFKEGCWLIEEKWPASVIGDADEWKKTQVVTDNDGTVYDFGDFPSRGLYMTVMVWADGEGRPLEPSSQLLERLRFQKQMREQKDISFDQVLAETEARQVAVEAQQAERWKAAEKSIAEDLKMNVDKILTSKTRFQSLPVGQIPAKNRIITLN